MKSRLIPPVLLLTAFCFYSITSTVSANAQINHDMQTSTQTESFAVTQELPLEYYPYTKVNITMTITQTVRILYNQVTDAKDNIHINGKASVRGTMYGEAWLYDETRQIWILGQQQSQSTKMFLALNTLTLDSQTHTSQEIRLLANRMTTNSIDLDTGQTVTVDVLVIEHVMFKLNNDGVQFEKSWEFLHNQPS